MSEMSVEDLGAKRDDQKVLIAKKYMFRNTMEGLLLHFSSILPRGIGGVCEGQEGIEILSH